MGRFPPGLPLIPGFLWDFWQPSAGPVGSSQGQQGARSRTPIVTNLYLLGPRFPPRPRSLEPARSRPSLSLPVSTTAPPRPSRVNKVTSEHDRRFLPATAVVPDPRIKPLSIPPPTP